VIPSVHRTISIAVGVSLFLAIAAGCSNNTSRRIQIGQSRDEVIGKPNEITEFTIPDEPYFGPQEGLANLLAAGTLVEEWRYVAEEEVTYVWFAGQSSEPREQWTVIDSAAYPVNAVY
jgi:hypothetical protein